ncbi:hypothetical protein [Rhodanobacter sp. PCA2]|uniref:hypothetical protein n=1 Tax=Rhodanobacter sp. PCA2 TaxID=2006117 RepID=UPI0015E6FAA0|nr:hypothetical protein [Rhodanobacter sp. PCA2]
MNLLYTLCTIFYNRRDGIVRDVMKVAKLLRGKEKTVCADTGYQGAERCALTCADL